MTYHVANLECFILTNLKSKFRNSLHLNYVMYVKHKIEVVKHNTITVGERGRRDRRREKYKKGNNSELDMYMEYYANHPHP